MLRWTVFAVVSGYCVFKKSGEEIKGVMGDLNMIIPGSEEAASRNNRWSRSSQRPERTSLRGLA